MAGKFLHIKIIQYVRTFCLKTWSSAEALSRHTNALIVFLKIWVHLQFRTVAPLPYLWIFLVLTLLVKWLKSLLLIGPPIFPYSLSPNDLLPTIRINFWVQFVILIAKNWQWWWCCFIFAFWTIRWDGISLFYCESFLFNLSKPCNKVTKFLHSSVSQPFLSGEHLLLKRLTYHIIVKPLFT